MSIAEMINQGTERQSQSWSILAKNLGDLGREVGNQLALQQYQKQAAEALPAMQAAYRSAMDDVSRGSVSEGYKKFMDAQFQFGGSQNPLISGPAQLFGKGFTDYATMYEKQQQRKAQYGGRGAMNPTYSLPTDEQLQSGEDFTPDVYQPKGPLPAMRDGMNAYEVDPKTGKPIVNVEAPLPEMEGVDRGFSFGVGAVSGGIDGGGQDFISTDELMIPANPPSKEDAQAILDWRALPPEKQDEATNEVVVSNVPKGKGKVVSFENIPGVPFAGMVGQNKKNIPTIKREYTTEGKGKVTSESGEELNDYDAAAHNATVIGTRISGNKKLMDLFDAAGGNWNNVRISQETNEAGEPANYAFINGQKFDFPLTSVQMQKDTVPEAFGEVQMIEFVKGLPALAKANGWKLIEQKAPAAQPSAGEKKERFPEKKTEAPSSPQVAAPATAPAASAKEMTLEERISAKTSSPTSTRTATPEQLAGVKAGQVRQQKASLESEATKLERALYDMPRTAGGKKQLKRGLSAQDPDVKSALQRIAEIKKQLEAL
jgi:hypothetical protein